MDPIIRFAPASPFARRIGRHAVGPLERAASSPSSAPGLTDSHFAAGGRAPGLSVYLASPVSAAQAEAPPVRDWAAEMAVAACEHRQLLDQRDAEIARLRETAQQHTAGLVEARVAAEQRGYADGDRKGRKAARDALQAQIERIGEAAARIGEARQALIAGSEDAVVELVFTALTRIIGQHGGSRDTVIEVVRTALSATRSRDQITVRLHPDDAALFGATMPAVQGGTALRVEADATLTLGGCIIDSAGGSLDASFRTQLEQLGAALRAARDARRLERATS